MNNLVTITNQKATTTSLLISESFEKQHKNILRDIANLECSQAFTELNFEPSAYKDASGRMLPMFNITRDGFSFLAMGFTGKKAAEFKERFIAAFNAMEKTLIDNQGERRQIDMNHRRLSTAPNGLDIRYNLDLTKILINPTPKSILLLSRLTGIDLEDIAEMPTDHQLMTEQALNQALAKTFLTEACTRDPDATISAADLYQAFTTWSQTRHPDRKPPSQKTFGMMAGSLGLKKEKGEGGLVYYLDISLKSTDHGGH